MKTVSENLELAGWYQTVPYLQLLKPVRMTYSYNKLSVSNLDIIRELIKHVKQGIAECMM
jgi:hypothetical protein